MSFFKDLFKDMIPKYRYVRIKFIIAAVMNVTLNYTNIFKTLFR